MNANLRKATNLFREFADKHGNKPTYVDCYIRWKDDGNIRIVTIALFDFGGEENEKFEDDDKIFFYAGNIDFIISNLANIDYTSDEFEDRDEFEKEIKKDSKDFPEWFDFSAEDFTILDVVEYADNLEDLGW